MLRLLHDSVCRNRGLAPSLNGGRTRQCRRLHGARRDLHRYLHDGGRKGSWSRTSAVCARLGETLYCNSWDQEEGQCLCDPQFQIYGLIVLCWLVLGAFFRKVDSLLLWGWETFRLHVQNYNQVLISIYHCREPVNAVIHLIIWNFLYLIISN